MNKYDVLKRNRRLLGLRYVFWDIPYQFFRKLHRDGKESEGKQGLIKKRINNYYMFIEGDGKGIHRDLRLHGTREIVSTKIVHALLSPGDIVLDAGANIGYYVIIESKKVGAKGLVYAVEPVKDSFRLLERNIKLNGLKNVKLYNLAFDDREGEVNINVSSESNLSGPLKAEGIKRVDKVKATTLDSFFKNKRKPTFMRIDIEGFEDVVFKGGLKTLDSLRILFVELHFPLLGKKRMVTLLNVLKKKGFEIDTAVLEWERWVENDSVLGQMVNYLHKKRSKPLVIKDLTIDLLIKNKDFIEGHHSLEVFFVKKN